MNFFPIYQGTDVTYLEHNLPRRRMKRLFAKYKKTCPVDGAGETMVSPKEFSTFINDSWFHLVMKWRCKIMD